MRPPLNCQKTAPPGVGTYPGVGQTMGEHPMDSHNPTDPESDIETLARETHTPVATVQEIYQSEHAKLDRVARIKTFIPVLIHRRVKELLRSRHSSDRLRHSAP